MKTRTSSTNSRPEPVELETASRVGIYCLLAVPILLALADVLRLRAEGGSSFSGGVGAAPDMVPHFESLALHRPEMAVATVLTFATAFVAMFAVSLLWKLSAKHSPVLGRIVLVLGAFFVLGRVIHTIVYFGTMLYFSANYPPAQAAKLNDSMGSFWVVNMVIVPTVIGLALWLPLAGVLLWRVKAIPLWAAISVAAGTLVLIVAGSSFATTILMALATVAGFAPLVWRRLAYSSSPNHAVALETGGASV